MNKPRKLQETTDDPFVAVQGLEGREKPHATNDAKRYNRHDQTTCYRYRIVICVPELIRQSK